MPADLPLCQAQVLHARTLPKNCSSSALSRNDGATKQYRSVTATGDCRNSCSKAMCIRVCTLGIFGWWMRLVRPSHSQPAGSHSQGSMLAVLAFK